MQDLKTRLIEFLRDLDWHLAVAVDSCGLWLAQERAAMRRDWVIICAFAATLFYRVKSAIRLPRLPKLTIPQITAPQIPAFNRRWDFELPRFDLPQFNLQYIRKAIFCPRCISAYCVLILLGIISFLSSPDRHMESPDQPIQHIYANFGNEVANLAGHLNPISKADAALPAAEPQQDADEGQQILSAESNNGGEQSLADDTSPREKTVKLARGQSFTGAIISTGLDKKEAQSAASALRQILNPKTIDIGEEITVSFKGKNPDKITFTPSHDKRITITRLDTGKYKAKSETRPVDVRLNMISATINNSISEAAKKAGIPKGVLSDMIRVFSYDVDFQRELHSGDKIEVAFEEIWDEEGRFIKSGNMVYANLKYGKKELEIYRYKPSDDSRADYFNSEGKAVRKALLRTPVDGARITRGFGMRRHPILGYSKMHEGVDFGASIGTPVLAAGDGVVVQKGWNGGYGHYVEIKHNSNYRTAYGHLSKYAQNLRVGGRVHQGDVIAYVGSTGLSTGPHLHYEVIRSARKINPIGVKFPTGRILAGKELQKFKLAMDTTKTKIAAIKPGTKPGKKPAQIASR